MTSFTYRNIQNNLSGQKRGFSLLELLVYIGVLAFISVTVISSLFVTIRAFSDIRVSRDIHNAAVVSFGRMSYEIRTAYNIDIGASTFGSSPGVLSLYTTDISETNTIVEFSVATSSILIKEAGVEAGLLTPPNITVDSLIFELIDTTNSQAVKIDLTLTGTRGNITKTKRFYNTIILRGSY